MFLQISFSSQYTPYTHYFTVPLNNILLEFLKFIYY